MILNIDISTFIQWFLNSLITIISQAINILKSIEFLGTNLLNFTITITILNILIPILINIAKERKNKSD